MQTITPTEQTDATLEQRHHYMMARAALRTLQADVAICPAMAPLLPVEGEDLLSWYEAYDEHETNPISERVH